MEAVIFALMDVVIFILVFAIPIIGTRNENTNKTIGRLRFLAWFVLALLLLFIGFAGGLSIIIVAVFFIFSYFFQQAVVRRARDAGYSKRLAYWAIVPVANLCICIYLLFASSKRETIHQPTTSSSV
jgi:hypothetical protein